MRECQIGLGLRTDHYPHLLEKPNTSLQWFEAISENYMDSQGRPLEILEKVRTDYEVALHGVSLSLGSTEKFCERYLKSWKALIDRIEPFRVSDHLCWTGNVHGNIHDLLPLPLNDQTLRHLCSRIQHIQDRIERPLLIENVSSYLTYKDSTYTEWEFLEKLCQSSGCQILLDVNNVYVSAKNHGFDATDFLDGISSDSIGQIHLAGFTDMGTYLFDTHSKPVHEDVWKLFRHLAPRLKETPIMIEWDDDIPQFSVVEAEALKAKEIWECSQK